jgi:hypothetical protein
MTNPPAPLIYETLLTQVTDISKSSEKIGYLKAIKDVTSIIETTASKSKSKLEIRALTELVSRLSELTA